MRVAILYNEPVASRYDAFGEGEAIRGVLDSVQGVKDALTAQGHDVTLHGLIPPIADCVGAIHQIEADVIFNLFEGFDGRPETEAQIALELEAVGIPFTGASSGILALCQNKARTKKLLMSLGIATADYQLLSEANLDSFNLEFPVIVKPAAEDASHGLSQKSVVNDIESLEQQVIEMERGYGGPVLVERFISGREFNLSISGGETPRPLSISEIVYSSDMPGPKILTFDAKWSPENPAYLSSTPVCPAEVSEEMRRRIEELSLAAYKAVGAPPYARVDLRCDDHERPYVLEVNPNPDLSPEAGLALQAGVAGMCYGELVKSIVGMADAECHSKIRLRPMIADDVERLAQITADTGFFRTDEIEVAREVLTDAASGDDSGYDVRVACNDDGIMGYVCFGATPLTRATWDIYWLAVAPDHQRKGVGRRLMRFAEEQIALKQGRLILVETSSQEMYEPTRKFYESIDYEEVSRIADFYDTGDAKVTFGKVLSG